jgi:SAM-dependent methyltransferase
LNAAEPQKPYFPIPDGVVIKTMSAERTAKEFIRDLITRSGLAKLHVLIRKARKQNVDHLLCNSLAERFSAVYRNGVWLRGRPSGSLSGLGSELENTESIRRRMPEFLETIATQTLLDLGCGDFNWMKEVQLPCRYIGADIVRDVIEANASLYGSARRSFQVLDATSDPLPPADTVLCREVMFHLSFRDIWRLIQNVRASGASFLIATNDEALKLNADIISGDFRSLNLRKAPFHFRTPLLSIPDGSIDPDRVLAVWGASELPRPPKVYDHYRTGRE